MALIRKDIVVKPNSVVTKTEAIASTRTWLNSFQNAESNINLDASFKNFYFGDCFDSRTGNVYRVFSDACSTQYSMPSVGGLISYDIVNKDVLALKSEIPSTENLASRSYVDNAIATIAVSSGGDASYIIE